MKCPFCSHENTRVIDSRPADENNSIRRRRVCDECGKRFTTYEKVETIPLIVIKKDNIEIVDDGCGMNRDDLAQSWMHIGKSSKGYEIDGANGKKRVQAGSKGVGRFALARLGASVEVYSHKSDCKSIAWITDWNYSTLEEVEDYSFIGTKMIIAKLQVSFFYIITSIIVLYIN